MRALILAAALFVAAPAVAQEKFVSSNVDVRTLIDFKVSEAALQKMLPDGWAIDLFSGASAGANLRVTLVDPQMVQNAEAKSVAPVRVISLGVPVKKKDADVRGNMVITGYVASAAAAPGPYGVYGPARARVERGMRSDEAGTANVEESWMFTGEDGGAVQIQLQYVRGIPDKQKVDGNVYSAAKPGFFRIYRFEMAADVVRGATGAAERLSKFSLKATGGKIGTLLDGSEQLISVTSVPWYARQIFLPGS
jgi:hypothetical protein